MHTTAEAQLVLTDLPGWQRPIDPLTERMQGTVDASLEEIDAVLLVIDCRARIGAGIASSAGGSSGSASRS